jgi:hypothetical protein
LGIPPKPEEEEPEIGMEAGSESLTEWEVGARMPEMNSRPEGLDETPREEQFAGYRDEGELPAGEQADDASRRAADILARALSRAEVTLEGLPFESHLEGEPPDDIDNMPVEDAYPWEPTEPLAPEQPPQPPEPPQPPAPPASLPPDAMEQMTNLIRQVVEHFDASLQQMAEERRVLIEQTQASNEAARDQTQQAYEQTQQALAQMQEFPRMHKEQLDLALQSMAEERRAFFEESRSAQQATLETRQDVPQDLAEHFSNALDRMAEERRTLVDETIEASRASREHADRMIEQIQELVRSLTEHFDRALDRMTEERRSLIDESQSAVRSGREQMDRGVDRMEQDRRFLAEQMSTLGRSVERLETRFDDLNRAVSESRRAAPIAEEQAAPVEETEAEPAFQPGGEGLTLVISAVPGFQGLMEVQRALTRVPAIEGASVERYFDGEARIVLTLSEPITATRLLEAMTEASGQELKVEESRPDAMRLRVRFQDGEE